MITKIDIHGFDVRLERAERKLHNPLSRMNTELVKNFEKAILKAKDELLPEDLLTEEEVKRIIYN
ncbi:MAG: hypothetical protein QXD42_03960 [Nitrososphaerales archaeon]